ncbi:MAG: oligosaccharide flippase family protein [bacterium]
MKFRNEVSRTIITQIFILLFGIGTSIVLNRLLGPTLKGELVALLVIPQLIVAFTNLGLGTSLSYHLGKGKYPEADIIKTNFVCSLVLGIIGVGIGWFVLRNSYPELNILFRYFILGMIIFGLWFDYLPDIFLGNGKMGVYNYWHLLKAITEFLLIVVFVLAITNKLQGAITGIFIQNLSLWILSIILFMKLALKGKINFSYLKEGLNFGYKIFFTNVLIFLSYRLDILLLKWLSNTTQIGYYSTAVSLAEKLWIIPGAISLVLYSKIVSSKNAENYDSNKVLRVTRISFWVITGIAIVSIFLIKPVIEILYSARFLPSVTPYIILLPGTIALVVVKLLMAEIVGKWGKPELSIIGMLIVVFTNIGLNLILIPKLNIAGAAIASTVAYTVQFVYFITVYNKVTHIPVKEIFALRKKDFTMSN